MVVYVGIDPGRGGGLAFISGGNVVAEKMPATDRDLLDLLDGWAVRVNRGGARAITAMLEHVWSMPGQGHGGAFAFGKNVGAINMALIAAGIPYDLVIPRKWQAELGVRYRPNSSDTEKKNVSKRRAQQLFPHVEVTHAIADALLLAEFCRRSHGRQRR